MTGVERLGAGALVVLIAVGAAFVWTLDRRAPRERFCTTGLAITEVDGVTYSLEDQAQAGPDDCNLVGAGIGFDCKVRRDGRVVGSLRPNRSDGTCGQPGPDGRALTGPIVPTP
jgi:hypothetical protein